LRSKDFPVAIILEKNSAGLMKICKGLLVPETGANSGQNKLV